MRILQFEVSLFDPIDFSQYQGDKRAEDGGQDYADEQQACPVKSGGDDGLCTGSHGAFAWSYPSSPNANRTTQPAGSHSGIDRSAIHFKFENTGGDRSGDETGQNRGNPYFGIADNVAHL